MNFFSSGRNTIGKVLENSQNISCEIPLRHKGHDAVRHSNVSESFKITYIEFEDLPPYPPGTDLMFIFNNIKQHFDSPDWLDSFNSINNLRILNKYHGEEINLIFQAFGNYILESVLSSKTALVKNILAFFKEVLQRGQQIKLDIRIITKLIQILLSKCKSSHKAIKAMSETCLQAIVENFTCDDTLVEFCTNTIRKNKTVDKEGFHFLANSISIMNENISKINNETLRYLFITMKLVISSDSGDNKALAKRIIRFIFQLMGKDNFINYLHFLVLNKIISEKDSDEFMEIVSDKQKVRPSIAQSIKQRRSQLPYKAEPNFEFI